MTQPTIEALEQKLLERSPEFEAWAHSLPPKHWSLRDISAARIGWEAARAADQPSLRRCPDCDTPMWPAEFNVPCGRCATMKADQQGVRDDG
jgi:hypothetical protein